uniref:Uncharacterized protein n=1 Tax=Molossus molossus TaxID=27622 RepID=A0A7J8I042_MOLMO|nr:hypothetical protein HJG59_010898 [Molossus molossus]
MPGEKLGGGLLAKAGLPRRCRRCTAGAVSSLRCSARAGPRSPGSKRESPRAGAEAGGYSTVEVLVCIVHTVGAQAGRPERHPGAQASGKGSTGRRSQPSTAGVRPGAQCPRHQGGGKVATGPRMWLRGR